MTIKLNSYHLKSKDAWMKHYENQRKDKEWENDVNSYYRNLRWLELTSDSEIKQRIQNRLNELKAKWPGKL